MKMTSIKRMIYTALIAFMSAAAQASDNLPRGQQSITALPELSVHEMPVRAEVTTDSDIQGDVGALASAPPLTDMWVYAVGSTDCGWEYTAGQTMTTCNHGGLQLRTAILEIGYGSSRIAWMNGALLSSSSMYASTPVCVTGGYYTWPCTAGQTVVGFLNEYNLDGYQNGIFKYQNTSTNSPWNTMSVQISIL